MKQHTRITVLEHYACDCGFGITGHAHVQVGHGAVDVHMRSRHYAVLYSLRHIAAVYGLYLRLRTAIENAQLVCLRGHSDMECSLMVESLHSDTRERHIGGPRLLEQPRSHRGAGGAERVVVGLVGAGYLERDYQASTGIAGCPVQTLAHDIAAEVGLDVRVAQIDNPQNAVAGGRTGELGSQSRPVVAVHLHTVGIEFHKRIYAVVDGVFSVVYLQARIDTCRRGRAVGRCVTAAGRHCGGQHGCGKAYAQFHSDNAFFSAEANSSARTLPPAWFRWI